MDISALRRQHEDISATAGTLAAAIGDDNAPQAVSALRWKLARQLMAHLALEDSILYPAMQRSPDERARATAARIQSETGALAAQFTAYITDWSDDRIAQEWSGFCRETRALLKALSDRVQQENQLLYPLAEAIEASDTPVARRA